MAAVGAHHPIINAHTIVVRRRERERRGRRLVTGAEVGSDGLEEGRHVPRHERGTDTRVASLGFRVQRVESESKGSYEIYDLFICLFTYL